MGTENSLSPAPTPKVSMSQGGRLMHLGKFRILGRNGNGGLIEISEPDSNLQFDLCSFAIVDTRSGTIRKDLTEAITKINIEFSRGIVSFGNPSGPVEIRATLPVLLDWTTYSPVDLDVANLEKSQEMMNDWLRKMKIPEGCEYWKKVNNSCIPMFSALSGPGLLLEHQFSLALLMFIFFVLDDIFDNYKDFWNAGIPTNELLRTVDVFCSICKGEEYDESIGETTKFPQFQNLCDFFQLYRDGLIPVGLDYCVEFIREAVDCLEANAFENQGWTGVDGYEDERQEERYYYVRRESTYGWLSCVESICAYRRILISKEIRRDPLMALIRRRWVRVALIVNDLISVQKEISNGEKSNILLIRAKRMSGAKSLEKTLKDLANYVQEVELVQEKLMRKFRTSRELESLEIYLDNGKATFDTNLQFMLFAERYGQRPFSANLFFDTPPLGKFITP